MSAPSKTWKTAELKICRMLGIQKVGNSGQATPDGESEHLVAEIKHGRRYRLARWLHDELGKARSKAGDGRVGVVVVHEPGQNYADSIVFLRLQDYADWYGETPMNGASDAEMAILAPDMVE